MSNLRELIKNARQARARPELVDAYVIALADLADIAERHLDSLDACRVGRKASMSYDEQALREVVCQYGALKGALAKLGQEYGFDDRWQANVMRRLSGSKPSWWHRAWAWLVRPH